MMLACSNAFAFEFWDGAININTAEHPDTLKQYLSFTTTGSDNSWYQVGCYPYAQVNGVWTSAVAADPGPDYGDLHLKTDAMAMFFDYDSSQAKFLIIAGIPPSGITASQWYGGREFGPGDLKLDIGGNIYGIGMRDGGLHWAEDHSPDASYLDIHEAESGAVAQDQHVRDASNIGQIKLNPDWYHVDNPDVFGIDKSYAFFDATSGISNDGTATINVEPMNVQIGDYPMCIYAYEVIVPWASIGVINGAEISFTASWRPDCGNDIINKEFSVELPEPCSLIAILTGLIGLIGLRRRL